MLLLYFPILPAVDMNRTPKNSQYISHCQRLLVCLQLTPYIAKYQALTPGLGSNTLEPHSSHRAQRPL